MNSLGAARAQFLATVRLPDRLIHGMGTRLALIASLSLAAILLSAAWAVSAASPALGDRVLEFYKKHRGEQVGNGECAGLATQALKAAGAKTRGGPDAPKPGDYVWGRQVLLVEASPEAPKLTGKVTDVLPGDIVQFHDTKFVTAHFPHHTAVVKEMADQHLTVYQQHVGGTKIVREGAVRIDKLAEGWLRFYRPIPEKQATQSARLARPFITQRMQAAEVPIWQKLRALLFLVFDGRVQGLEGRVHVLDRLSLVSTEVMLRLLQVGVGVLQFVDGPVQGSFLPLGRFLGLGFWFRGLGGGP